MRTVSTQRAHDWLAKSDLRPTRQRVLLAEALVGDGQHRHVTAENLFERAQGSGEKVSLATVYNTLRAFCDAGCCMKSPLMAPKAILTPTPMITPISIGKMTQS